MSHGVSAGIRALSPKSLRNIWITLCAFFTWADTEFRFENPMKRVSGPRFQKVDVEPFTQEEIERMLKVCTYSREAETLMRRKFAMRQPTANRDQVIILTLLDSGIRASEFSSLRVGDFDAKRASWKSVTAWKAARKGGKDGWCTWTKQLAMPSGDTWRSGKMGRMPMHPCLLCAGTAVSTRILCGT
jgi:integrase